MIKKCLEKNENIKSIIFNNIRKIRTSKCISSKQMAISLGLNACDYSKLEAGNKQHWEKYLDKIAYILKIDKYELYFTSKEELMADKNLNIDIITCLEKQKNTYIGIFRKFDELEKQKVDKILESTNEINRLNALISELKSEVKRLRDLLNGNEPENLLPIHQNISKYRERERERERE